jgi:hypothetical protein
MQTTSGDSVYGRWGLAVYPAGNAPPLVIVPVLGILPTAITRIWHRKTVTLGMSIPPQYIWCGTQQLHLA